MHYIFVVNARKDYEHIQPDLEKQIAQLNSNPKYQSHTIEFYHTRGIGDATRFTRIYCDLHPADEVTFVACGGNGTLIEVASGMVSYKEQKKHLALLQYGTATDFVHQYPKCNFKSVEALFEGKAQDIDIIRVNDYYAINVANFGLDSVVAKYANKFIEEGKKNAYGKAVAMAVLFARFNKVDITVDGEHIKKRFIINSTIANGPCVGNGIRCAPRAVNNDGLIEFGCIPSMTLVEMLLFMPTYNKGEHLEKRFTRRRFIYRQAKKITLKFPVITYACLDGELIPDDTFDIEILPKEISFVVPATF